MKTLYIAWRDPDSRRWFPVGRLSFHDGKYHFVYTQGARASSQFSPFQGMRDFDLVYQSGQLFPFFANRILSKSRPEYPSLLRWLKMEAGDSDPLTILALTGGVRQTDSFETFACPVRTAQGDYQISFFSHGLSHMAQDAVDRVNGLKPGDNLYLLLDDQNVKDPLAIALRTDDPPIIVGYCPRYLNEDFRFLISANSADAVSVTVEQVNSDAPLQFKLLCKFASPWPPEFKPCTNWYYQTLTGEPAADCEV